MIERTKEVEVFCFLAKKFPEGVGEAFRALEERLPSCSGRMFYGISHGAPDGGIVYKAAVSAFEGEETPEGCERFTITAGSYLAETLTGWRGNEQIIGKTFGELLRDPRLDLNFPCVEEYPDHDEMTCMIRLDPEKM